MSRDELIVVVHRQAGQITAQAGQLAELMVAKRGAGGEAGAVGASALA
jgi:hypothetical protein